MYDRTLVDLRLYAGVQLHIFEIYFHFSLLHTSAIDFRVWFLGREGATPIRAETQQHTR